MRVQCLYLAISAVFLATNCPTTTAQRHAVLPRAASTSSQAGAASSIAQSTTSSSSQATPGSSSNGMSSTSGTPTTATNAAASSSAALVTATPIVKGSLNVTGITTPKIEGLPIHPSITPGLAVAGTILILTGVFYTLIGIKTKWLHIFLSAAYIFALAVTILIEFVMHSPVSNAAQGGYVVAACLTGVVAGAGSLLFKDVTEGVGCFLGGFCLSMWVLVLRPGGTISNTTGKIIFISCLTVGAPALYISRHTRPYGLIGSTSFAGATATVLGIDCFSRAGLKEFWLYIWNLNNDIFPLHYSGPYPITRAIQVETGAIIIICAMGILSQTKVWIVIRRRREERAREQRRRDDEGNLVDEEQGRRVEDGIKREKGSWEAAYGSGERSKSQLLDSGNGTDEPGTRKGSLSGGGTSDVRGSDLEGIELREMDASPNGPKEAGRIVIHVAQDDEISPNPLASDQRGHSEGGSREPSIHQSNTGAAESSSVEEPLRNAAALRSVDRDLTSKPKITQLPFTVPEPDFGSEDGRSSVAASAASEYMTDRWSKRFSGSSSIVRKLSRRSQRSFMAASTSDEALMVPEPEDDRASSIAATIDGVSEKDDMEQEAQSVRDQRPSFEILREQDSMQALMQGTRPSVHVAKDAEERPGQGVNQMTLDDNQVGEFQHVKDSTHPRAESIALPDSDIASTTDARSTVETQIIAPEFQQNPRINRLSTNLPGGASRVVTAYRTNEWAKHLEGADLPEVDELKVKQSQAPNPSQPTERVAPVDVRALQQTPLSADPAPVLTVNTHGLGDKTTSYFQSKNPSHREQDRQRRNSVVHQLTRDKALERTPSQTYLANSMERSPSQTSLSSIKSRKEQYRPPLPRFRTSQSSVPSAHGLRSASSPMLSTPLVESPIEEGVEASFPTRFAPSSTHLMSQRDRMIRNRPSSTSLLRTNWSNATLDQHPALRALPEDEDISLSQRKSILQRHRHSLPHLHRSSSGHLSAAAQPIYPHNRVSPPSQSRSRRSPTPQPFSGRPSPTPQPLSGRPSPTPQPLSGRPSPTPPLLSGRPSPTLAHRDSTISSWHASLQATNTTAHYRDKELDARRAELMDEKRRESSSRQEQRVNQTRTQHVMDRGMRQSSMMDLHQQHMRKMQAEANKSLA